jgi:hypothetical protein
MSSTVEVLVELADRALSLRQQTRAADGEMTKMTRVWQMRGDNLQCVSEEAGIRI